MCLQCSKKPVYEFTNQRKLCARCFVRWFEKKVLYTIRKFEMIKNGDAVGYFSSDSFKAVVLENVLKMYAEKGDVKLVKLPAHLCSQIYDFASTRKLTQNQGLNSFVNIARFGHDASSRKFAKLIVNSLVENRAGRRFVASNDTSEASAIKRGGAERINKIAIPSTTDSEANGIVKILINKKAKDLENVVPVVGEIIKPLYLFLDKEVLLYAKLKKLKFKKLKEKKDEISEFIDGLEKKHPEVKQAIVKGILRLN